LQCKLQHDESRTRFRCLCFDEFPERHSKLEVKLQTEKLPGELQVAGFQFSEYFFLLQLKCDFLVGGQDGFSSFRNARNCEDAAQRLQMFVQWKVSIEETFYHRFAVLALNVHELRHFIFISVARKIFIII
jgi:hypothetical protein